MVTCPCLTGWSGFQRTEVFFMCFLGWFVQQRCALWDNLQETWSAWGGVCIQKMYESREMQSDKMWQTDKPRRAALSNVRSNASLNHAPWRPNPVRPWLSIETRGSGIPLISTYQEMIIYLCAYLVVCLYCVYVCLSIHVWADPFFGI